jgi:membrane protease YdiL (CAAX protease family)
MDDGVNISSEERESPVSESPAVNVSNSGPEFTVEPSYVWTVFFGPEGLRAGWGLAFYVGMYYLLQFVAMRWAGSVELDRAGLWSMMLEEFGVLVAAVIPAVLLWRIEGRAWGSYGLPGRLAFGKLFWVGTAWGFAAITLLMATMYGLRVFDVGHLAIHGARIVRFAVFWAAFFLLVGFFEEFLLRGYSQFTLTRAAGFWPAAVLLSCMFGVIHLRNDGEDWAGLLAVAAIGFFFCLTLRRTGSLWFAVGFHTAWDWGETFFYSVPDSGTIFPGHLLKSSFHGPTWLTGGQVGPEGSVLCFVVIGVAWAAFARRYPSVRYGVQEPLPQGVQSKSTG